MAPQQLRIGFDDAVGWLVTGAAPGPAGVVSLTLADLRITVDAVDAERLVEMAVFADAPEVPVPGAALDACTSLFGIEFGAALAARPVSGAHVTAVPTALWQQVARTARAEFVCVHDRRAPRIAALRLVSTGQALTPIGANELVLKRAWQAMPAVIAAGRTAAQHPELVDELSGPDRRDLAVALAALTGVLEADEWDGTGEEQVRALTDLLAPTLGDAEIAMFASGPDRGGRALAEDRPVPAYREGIGQKGLREGIPEKGLEVDWSAWPDDLRNRLGGFAGEAFAGAQAAGQLPGQVNVRMQLRDGAAQDAPDITVRVQAWDGEILGEGRLRIVTPAGLLPRGEGRITASAPSDTELARQYGVHVDVAVSGLAPLSADGLRQAARGLARRAGVRALLARHAGDPVLEAGHWQRCARMYMVAGDQVRAAAAEREARTVTSASAEPPSSGAAGSAGDWVYRLLANWLGLANRLIAATAALSPASITELGTAVRELSFAADVVPELARAHERFGSVLLESAQEEERTVAIGHLREALRLQYLLGDPQHATRLLRHISAADLPAADSGGRDDGYEEHEE
jgi:hypothetical protein